MHSIVGSGQRYQILWHVEQVKKTLLCQNCASKKHCHARIACVSRAILAWQCVFSLAQRVQKCDTNHIPWATAYSIS